MWPQIFQLLKYQWSEGKFDTLGKSGSAHRAQETPPSKGGVPSGWWEPGGPSEGFRRSPTRQEGPSPTGPEGHLTYNCVHLISHNKKARTGALDKSNSIMDFVIQN